MALEQWAIVDENNIVVEVVLFDVLDPTAESPCTNPTWGTYKVMNETPEIGMVWDGETFKFN
jgi:hypothetical protein